jgi:hypothetical protein
VILILILAAPTILAVLAGGIMDRVEGVSSYTYRVSGNMAEHEIDGGPLDGASIAEIGQTRRLATTPS